MEHAINQQVFEITCGSEERAAGIRNELVHYTASRINSLLQSVLDQSVPAQQTVVIERLEIDLGTLSAEEFGADELLVKFKNALAGELARYRPALPAGRTASGNAGKRGLTNSFELTTRFILTGELPWWADKTTVIEPDAHLMELIRHQPEQLRTFLQTVRGSREALLRIARQYKPSTRKELQHLMPELLFREHFNRPAPPAGASLADPDSTWLTVELLDQAGDYFEPAQHVKTEKRKARLLRKIIKLLQKDQPSPIGLSWLPEGLQHPVSGKGFDKNEVTQKLMALSVPRLELLQLYFLYLQDKTFTGPEDAQKPQARERHAVSQERLNAAFPEGMEEVHPSPQDFPPGTKASGVKPLEDHKKNNDGKNFISQESQEGKSLESSTDNSGTSSSGDGAGATSVKKDKDVPEKKQDDTGNFTVTDNRNLVEKELVFSKEDDPPAGHPDTLFPGEQATTTFITGGREGRLQNEPPGKGGIMSPQSSLSGRTPLLTLPQQKQLDFIAGRLGKPDAVFIEYLQTLSPAVIRSVLKSLRAEKKQAAQARKAADALIMHPFLLQYRLILLAASLALPAPPENSPSSSTEPTQTLGHRTSASHILDRLSAAQMLLIDSLQALPAKKALILGHIFQQKQLQGPDEQRHLKNFVRRLPEPAVQLLQFLSRLPEEVLRDLQHAESRQPAATDRLSTREPFLTSQEEGPKKFYLVNGGLCLVAPYLPGLFGQLGYLEGRAFKNNFYAVRALHALHYLATGSRKAPEYQLLFNKLLCGLPPEHTPGFNIRLTRKETAEIDGCLEAVIANWKALKNTSVQGFRESFLRRNAILSEQETAWALQVEKKDYDLLLNTIPWNFSLIKLPWMKKMIQVEWQN